VQIPTQSIHYPSVAPLWSATWRIHKLQTLRFGHEDPGKSKLPNGEANAKWRTEISTCLSINLSHKHVLKTVSWAHAYKSR